jgi:Protein ChrB, N-terminal
MPRMVSAPRPGKSGSRAGWLLVVVSTGGASSTLRVQVWRKLRSLGALYLQQSVALLPDQPQPRRVVQRLADRASREGGEVRVLPIAISDLAAERSIIDEFCRERADEYAEVCSRTPAFLEEIATERRKGRATYTEFEESEADLHRLESWLAKIQARDYFSASGQSEAADAIAECATTLSEFEHEALAAEIGDASVRVDARSHPRASPRLRAVEEE